MFELRIERGFSAAHSLRGYQGNCERLHGHNWKVDISLEAPKLDDLGMVMDFREVKKTADQVLSGLDHCYLNELTEFREVNPTTENIARVVFDRVSSQLREGLRVVSVTVWESPGCGATYRP